MTETKFVKRKKPNYIRALILLILLIVALVLFFNVDSLLSGLFEVSD
ncbi:MAG: hypothetical protein WBV45_11165 [Lutimonas sp.]